MPYSQHIFAGFNRRFALLVDGDKGYIGSKPLLSTAGFALRDCLKAVRGLPYVEIHITNVEARGIRPVTSGEANGVIAALASTPTSWHWTQFGGYWQGKLSAPEIQSDILSTLSSKRINQGYC